MQSAIWGSLKSRFTKPARSQSTASEGRDRDHNPFNIDLTTRSGIESSLVTPPFSDLNKIKSYQEAVDKLPMPPVLWNEFQRATARGASNRKIASIVQHDPVIAAALLKAANSPGFGLQKPIINIGRAISHLGYTMVRSVIAKNSFSQSFRRQGKAYNMEQLWKHGMAVSALAEIVGAHIPGCNREDAATIGLFHDIGRMGFSSLADEQMPAQLDHERGYLSYEVIRFGCTHVELGEIFAMHWQLPEKVRQGIKYHHYPAYESADKVPDSVRPEVLAVYLADLLSIHLEFPGGNPSKVLPNDSYRGMLPNTTLYEIMHEQGVSKELWRVNTMELY